MSRKWREAREEEGFTLIELLVVVIIIGILAAIAIPAFLNQRTSAWISAAESDARNAAIQIETVYTRTMAYPASADWGPGPATVDLDGAVVTVSNQVTLEYVLAEDGNTYVISYSHEQVDDGAVIGTYDSATGGISRN